MIPAALQKRHFTIQTCQTVVCGAMGRSIYMPNDHQAGTMFPIVELDPGMQSAAAFRHFAVSAARSRGAFGRCLHLHEADEYGAMRLFIDEDGLAGFAMKGSRILSVFCHADREIKPASPNLLRLAVHLGGSHLDAFDTVLPRLYGRAGFVEVGRVPWSDALAPQGWCYESFAEFNNGRPDVVFMEHRFRQTSGEPA